MNLVFPVGEIDLGRADRSLSSISEIMVLVPERYWLVLTFIGDESGTHDAKGLRPGSDCCGVFAYGAWRDEWKKAAAMWKGRLHGKVKSFHMRDFMRDKSIPYRDWTPEERERFIQSLIEVAVQKPRIGNGGLVYVPDYEQIVPDDLKQERGHPYYFSFQVFFDQLLPQLERSRLPKGQQVAFLFEQNQFQDLAAKAFWDIKAVRDKNNRLGSIDFLPKNKCVLFQIADMSGWLFREDLSRKKKGLPRRPWVDQLIARENVLVGFYDQKSLKIHVNEVLNTRRAAARLSTSNKP